MDLPTNITTAPDPNARPTVVTVCLIIITVCIAGAVLTALRSVITPMLIGLLLFFLINPLVTFFEERRMPTWMAYMVISLVAIVLVYLTGWFIQTQADLFQSKAEEYSKQAKENVETYAVSMGLIQPGEFDFSRYRLKDVIPISQEDLLRHLFGMTLEALESSALAVFYLLFMLIEARRWAMRTWNNLENDSAAKVLLAMEKMKTDIWRFLAVKTAVSLGLGVSTALICLAAGLDFWPLWGFVMFISNYVTYLGSILALGPPILIALVQFDNPALTGGLAIALTACRFIWIDFVEIRYAGMHINVSPLLVLFSLALLGWMWGVAGLLLAVPLVTSLRIALDSNAETAYLARLMGDEEEEPVQTPEKLGI